MSHDAGLEPLFPIADIQGDILVGLPKRHEHLMFFEVVDDGIFKKFLDSLDITSMQDCLRFRDEIAAQKQINDQLIPTPGLNIAFTAGGLIKLGIGQISAAAGIDAFKNGMASRQAILNDPPSASWRSLRPSKRLHGVFIVTGASHAEVANVISLRLAPPGANGWRLIDEEVGQVRPAPVIGHEHFGYADGVSQPGIRGRIAETVALNPGLKDRQGQDSGPDQAAPGQDVLWPGEFVFGYPAQNPGAASFPEKGPDKTPPIPFMLNGSFLVIRRLAQLVPEFNASVKKASQGLTDTSDPADPDLLGAQMVGRWKSGAALINAPTQDDRALGDNTPDANKFEFGDERAGLICPWAAHIRKAYPRDDVRHDTSPSQEDVDRAEAFTQTHRMLRRGIAFGPELTEEEALSGTSNGGTHTRGLLFKCYVTSIENQFEFVQQQWSNAADFSQEESGIDPIIGQSQSALRPFRGAAPVSKDVAKKPDLDLKSFVRMEGGEYFFAPAIPALRAL